MRVTRDDFSSERTPSSRLAALGTSGTACRPGDAGAARGACPSALLPNTALCWPESAYCQSGVEGACPRGMEPGRETEVFVGEWKRGKATVGTKWERQIYNPPNL